MWKICWWEYFNMDIAIESTMKVCNIAIIKFIELPIWVSINFCATKHKCIIRIGL